MHVVDDAILLQLGYGSTQGIALLEHEHYNLLKLCLLRTSIFLQVFYGYIENI